MNYDDILRSGICLFGSVETVAEKLGLLADMGIDHVMALQNFGALPVPEVERSMRMLIERVLPKVAARRSRTAEAALA